MEWDLLELAKDAAFSVATLYAAMNRLDRLAKWLRTVGRVVTKRTPGMKQAWGAMMGAEIRRQRRLIRDLRLDNLRLMG